MNDSFKLLSVTYGSIVVVVDILTYQVTELGKDNYFKYSRSSPTWPLPWKNLLLLFEKSYGIYYSVSTGPPSLKIKPAKLDNIVARQRFTFAPVFISKEMASQACKYSRGYEMIMKKKSKKQCNS